MPGPETVGEPLGRLAEDEQLVKGRGARLSILKERLSIDAVEGTRRSRDTPPSCRAA
jgi:hypothetical protein